MSLRKFLVIGTATLSFFLVVVLFFSIRFVANQVYVNSAYVTSRQTADRTFRALYQVMRKGWSREELEEYLTTLSRDDNPDENIKIFRSDKVTLQYGYIDQPELHV